MKRDYRPLWSVRLIVGLASLVEIKKNAMEMERLLSSLEQMG